MNIKFIFIIIFAYFLSACATAPLPLPEQNALHYLPQHKQLISEAEQDQDVKNYLMHYYSPWTGKQMVMEEDKIDPAETLITKQYVAHPGVGENGLPHSKVWMQAIIDNMNLNEKPENTLAITLRGTPERLLPTDEPLFKAWDGDRTSYKGYPFDRLQVSYLNPNIPVRVIHTSHDGAWKLIVNLDSIGWVRSGDIATVDTSFMSQWQGKHYAVFTQDNIPVKDVSNRFRFYSRIGAILPIKKMSSSTIEVLITTADQNQQAKIIRTKINKTQLAVWPLLLTSDNLGNLMNKMLNQPYAWGGLYGFRDCTLTTMSLYAPFGIWLPRNSQDQAKTGALHISLNGLSNEAMRETLKQHAISGLTLLEAPGHEAVFLQVNPDEFIVFHNVWSLGSHDPNNIYARTLITRIPIHPIPNFAMTNLVN